MTKTNAASRPNFAPAVSKIAQDAATSAPQAARSMPHDSYAKIAVPPPPHGEDEYRYPGENGVKKTESEVAKVLSFFGRVPALRNVGYHTLDLFQPIQKSGKITNLGQVDTNLYRGEQLGAAGFATLKKMGIHTVINLEAESDADRKFATAEGMKLIEIPEAPVGEMPLKQGVQFLSAATNPANGKIYFHCYHGSDRTGAMAAIYQICVQGKSIKQALAGMPKYGFHAGFEDQKVQFIYDFVKYWNTLPAAQKAQILHQ